ncbi:MAG: hypothetical protein ACAI44_25705 [Candidatus Sericytochromatia bacterium]
MDTYTAGYEPETYEDMPDPDSPDFVSALLSFDSSELGSKDEFCEDMLVRKACELKQWKYEGSHPRFLVENWIEVVVTGKQQGSCRILNGRTHAPLVPFTLDTMIKQIGKLCQWLREHQSDEDFSAWLLAAYDELADASGDEVKLHDIYRLINTRQPSYRREAFGVDLARTLARSSLLEGRRVRLGYKGGPLTQRYALCLNLKRTAQVADVIKIEPALQSLDI